MKKSFYALFLTFFLIAGLSSCASNKGGGWYKNRNNTYVPEKPADVVKADASEEFMCEAEMILSGEEK